MSKSVKGIHVTMFYGVLAQVVTSIAMAEANKGEAIDPNWVSSKLSVAVGVLVVAFLGLRVTGNTTKNWVGMGGLNLLNLFALVVEK